MKHRSLLAQTALAALGLGVLLLAACGGRYQITRDVEDDTVSGGSSSGGASSPGGSAPSHAGSSSAGSPSAGSSSAGSSSAGASSAGSGAGGDCINVKCASVPKCLGGTTPVIQPGQCCPTSCSICPPCPMVGCPAGTHLETAASDCCPSCVSDADAFCRKGQQAYAMQREEILNKYRYGCASNSECVTLAPVNLCEQGCSYAAVWYGVADSFESNLSNAADTYCGGCKLGPIPPCVPPPAPICFDGQCQLSVISPK
jgi:hypothetical protein